MTLRVLFEHVDAILKIIYSQVKEVLIIFQYIHTLVV